MNEREHILMHYCLPALLHLFRNNFILFSNKGPKGLLPVSQLGLSWLALQTLLGVNPPQLLDHTHFWIQLSIHYQDGFTNI